MTRKAIDDRSGYDQMVGASKSLRGLAAALCRTYGIPMQAGTGLRGRVLEQVRVIQREAARQAFQEGYRQGAEAAVQSVPHDGWEDVVVPRTTTRCLAGDVGRLKVGPIRASKD